MSREESEGQITIEDVEMTDIVDWISSSDAHGSQTNHDPSQNSEEIPIQDSDENEGGEDSDVNVIQTCHGHSLLQQALDKKIDNEAVVGQWIAQYKKNSNNALVAFVQFVIEASGCRYKIPEDTILTSEYIDIIIDATAKFCNISVYYPMTKKDASTFMRNVENFLRCFLLSIDATPIINDDIFLGHITGFVIACSKSKIRPFRHTSTMIGLKMLTILNDLTSIEYGKLKELWLKMFQCIFEERYRDVADDIRYLCLNECISWFEKYPESFLKPQNLDYIFEALRDEFVKIREYSLMSIHQLYAKGDLRELCLEQGKKYINDLIAITLDSENELGEYAVNLMEKFSKASQNIIDDSQYLIIDQLIFAANRGLAQAAAKLFSYRYLSDPNSLPDHDIRLLMVFFQEFGQHEHAAYLVDSFYGINPIILDWSTMVKMLKEQSLTLDENSIAILIEILTRGVKQAITGEIPAGRYTKNLSRIPKVGSQDLATKILAPVMPLLISKYCSSENLINLLELPQHLNLLHYKSEVNQEQLVQLLENIEQIIFENEDLDVLRMTAATLEYIYQIPYAKSFTHKLFSTAVTNYKNAYKTWHDAESGNTYIQPLQTTLRVLSSLCGYFDLDSWNISDTIRSRLQMATQDQGISQDQSLPPEILCHHLKICYFNLSWDFKRVKNLASNKVDVVDKCLALKENLDDFLFVSCYLIEKNDNTIVANDAFNFTCDLLILFGDQLRLHSNSSIRSLQYQTSINEYELFDKFILRNVFQINEGESEDELLHKDRYDELESKRRILVSYCKLVAFNLMPIMRASIIFQYYHRFYDSFGDILNATMELGLKINTIHYGMTLLHTCLLVYRRIKAANDGVTLLSTQTNEFEDLIKLAKRLAETFNSKLLKNRRGIVALHRSGIMFVSEIPSSNPTSPPENLTFLRVLEEFVPQLLAQDKLEMLNFLERIEEPSLPSCKCGEWQPLTDYRMALEMALKKSCRRRELNERLNYGKT